MFCNVAKQFDYLLQGCQVLRHLGGIWGRAAGMSVRGERPGWRDLPQARPKSWQVLDLCPIFAMMLPQLKELLWKQYVRIGKQRLKISINLAFQRLRWFLRKETRVKKQIAEGRARSRRLSYKAT